jgi:Mycothiol maleylpyruvate isomerase N-terminal domain
MNAFDILKYGHLTVCKTIEGLPEPEWATGGVCGYWSVKDVIGHLAAYELVLEEVLGTFLGRTETPNLKEFTAGPGFNDAQAALRATRGVQDVLGEYNNVQARVMLLVPQISPEVWREAGRLPWYGTEYALDDFIVYQYYGHKREHCAQIAVFCDTLK